MPTPSMVRMYEGRVEAQAVEVELVEPHQGVVVEVGTHLLAAVVGARLSPRGCGALVVVEVDPTLALLAPAVELPEREVARAEVVEHDVDDDGDAVLVGLADDGLEQVGPAVGALDGEGARRVVAPRVVPGELGDGHQLDRGDAEVPEVAELAGEPREVAGSVTGGEGPDVGLVDDELVVRGAGEAVVLPVEGVAVVDDRVAGRARDGPGPRVDPVQPVVAVADEVLVLVAGARLVDVDRPVSVVLRRQRVGVAGPVVEAARRPTRRRRSVPRPGRSCPSPWGIDPRPTWGAGRSGMGPLLLGDEGRSRPS